MTEQVVEFAGVATTFEQAHEDALRLFTVWMESNKEAAILHSSATWGPCIDQGTGFFRPQAVIRVTYKPAPVKSGRGGSRGTNAKPRFEPRVCEYCRKQFMPNGNRQRFCDRVCRAWAGVEAAEAEATGGVGE